MSRYYFDIHADYLSQLDESGEECGDRAAIERCVMDLLTARLVGRHGGRRLALATASVRDGAGLHVLTAMLGSRTGLRLSWAETDPGVDDPHVPD